jgi:phospholipid/cholesterol/gamma-HCH transport system ATP-binding protein
LARAIMMRPVILLCDEPFSGLDPVSVKRIEALLARINREYEITVVLVSHHVASTVRVADQVVVLLPDRAVTGTADELRQSGDPRVAAFFNEESDDSVDVEPPAGSSPPASTPSRRRRW